MFRVNEWIKKMSGLDNMRKRMLFEGGGLSTSDGRNVNGKLLSFNSALWNSQHAEWITFDNDETKQRHRCLINPDKLKEDYDQKEISIKLEDGLKEGQTFCWTRTNTHWIVYLQRLYKRRKIVNGEVPSTAGVIMTTPSHGYKIITVEE